MRWSAATSRSLYATELLAQTRAEHLSAAVEQLCQAFTSRWPPNLEALAATLGVRKIERCDLPYEGLLLPIGSGYEIRLNRWSSAARQRFTLAHELGHVLLHRLLPDTRSFERRDLFTAPGCLPEEELADAIGAELLMPARHVREVVATRGLSPEGVRCIHQRSGASLTASCRRVREVTDRSFGCCLLDARGFVIRRVLMPLEGSSFRTGTVMEPAGRVGEAICAVRVHRDKYTTARGFVRTEASGGRLALFAVACSSLIMEGGDARRN
mgnify:CR=1 FL=1